LLAKEERLVFDLRKAQNLVIKDRVLILNTYI
jgi:hypothetical protein